jgi:hypothetical protein
VLTRIGSIDQAQNWAGWPVANNTSELDSEATRLHSAVQLDWLSAGQILRMREEPESLLIIAQIFRLNLK